MLDGPSSVWEHPGTSGSMVRNVRDKLQRNFVARLGLGDIDFFCVSRYLRRVSRYTRYIGGIQIIGNQSDT